MMNAFVKNKFLYYSIIKNDMEPQKVSKLNRINVIGNTLKSFQNCENKQIFVHQEPLRRGQDIFFIKNHYYF